MFLFVLGGCSSAIDTTNNQTKQSNPSGEQGSSAQTNETPGTAPPVSKTFDNEEEVEEAFSGDVATFESDTSFRQVSLMFNGATEPALEWRARRGGQPVGEWKSVDITWSEEDAHVGRIILDEAASALDLRSESKLTFAHIEFSEDVRVDTDEPLAKELPTAAEASETLSHGQTSSTAQYDAVVTRSEWGARSPYKRCGRPHNPYRISIHHTYSPSNDGGNPALRMRQMQAFHIDTNGWCDIGYHFVVSQSGKIYEGRRWEQRTGAHVGGHNTGNIGVSLIGNFDRQSVGAQQFDAMVDIVHRIHETYNIPLDRAHLKGHQEWSGQSTSCPGQSLLNRLGELARKADTGTGPAPGSFDGTFSDDDDSVHEQAIETLAKKNVVSGCTSGQAPKFCPKQSVTRGQFITMIDSTLSLPQATRDYFSDDNGKYYEDAANRLAKEGIIKGCGQTAYSKLCPEQAITRAEVAVLLNKSYSLVDTSNDYFTDDNGHWAEDAINDVAASAVVSGCTSSRFCPDDKATRAQSATVICKANGWNC